MPHSPLETHDHNTTVTPRNARSHYHTHTSMITIPHSPQKARYHAQPSKGTVPDSPLERHEHDGSRCANAAPVEDAPVLSAELHHFYPPCVAVSPVQTVGHPVDRQVLRAVDVQQTDNVALKWHAGNKGTGQRSELIYFNMWQYACKDCK